MFISCYTCMCIMSHIYIYNITLQCIYIYIYIISYRVISYYIHKDIHLYHDYYVYLYILMYIHYFWNYPGYKPNIHNILYMIIWFDMILYDMIWHDMIWYDIVYIYIYIYTYTFGLILVNDNIVGICLSRWLEICSLSATRWHFAGSLYRASRKLNRCMNGWDVYDLMLPLNPGNMMEQSECASLNLLFCTCWPRYHLALSKNEQNPKIANFTRSENYTSLEF